MQPIGGLCAGRGGKAWSQRQQVAGSLKTLKSTSDVPLARAYVYTAATGRTPSLMDKKTAATQVSVNSFGFDYEDERRVRYQAGNALAGLLGRTWLRGPDAKR